VANSPCDFDAARRTDDDRLIERAVLEEVLHRHPERLTVNELCALIAGDPEDAAETEAIRHASRQLRRSGVVRYRNDDQVVEATHPTLRMAKLMELP
jgi:hypothetical protein